MISTEDALKRVPLLSDLSENDIKVLSHVATVRKYDKNEIIIHKQDPGDTFYSLIAGSVKVVLTDDEGKEFIVGILKEKDFFGELSLLDGEPRSATIVANDLTEVVVLRREDFLREITNHPEMCIKVVTELGRRLRRANESIESLAFLDVCGRLARFLMDMAAEQSGEEKGSKHKGDYEVNITYSRTELANLIGTTRETLTRALKTLENMGYIMINRNNIIITNVAGLQNRI